MKTTTIACAAIVLSVASAPVASAQEETASIGEQATPWTIGVAPRVGLTVPTSKLGAFVVGALEVDYALPVLNHQLVVALDGAITRPNYGGMVSDPRVGGSRGYEIHETELKVGLDAIYRIFGADHRLVPYGGLGPMLHMLKTSETTTFAIGTNTAQNTQFGFEVLGGADYRLGPGLVMGEVRFAYSNLDHLFTGDTNAGNVMISFGYRFVF